MSCFSTMALRLSFTGVSDFRTFQVELVAGVEVSAIWVPLDCCFQLRR